MRHDLQPPSLPCEVIGITPARKVVSGDAYSTETVEQAFVAAWDAESAVEEHLVDEGWQAEVGPESVEVDGNAPASESTVEPAPDKDRRA